MKYRTITDIIIPAGTVLFPPPTASSRWGEDFEAPFALDRDHTGYLSLSIPDGIEAGVIEEVTD